MTRSAARRAKVAQEKLQRKIEREPLVLEFDYIPDALQAFGPIINTDLTITPAHRDALVQAGQPIPPKVRCRFLIDTGADMSLVKHEFAEQAGLKLINVSVPLQGVGVDTTGRVYIGRIVFALRFRISKAGVHQIFVDTQIGSAKLEIDRIDGLIGRDVLRHFVLSCDGRSGQVRMKYHRPPPRP
jgi:predicted aspartyl protease